MAFEEQHPLDYRSGGDRVKTWGQKYLQEIPHIYNILNMLLKHQSYGDAQMQNEDGAMKIFTLSIENEDGTVRTERHLAIGIDNGTEFQWVDIGQVAPRFGAPTTDEALTTNDVATQEYEAYKLVKTNRDGILPTDITGSAAKMVGKVIAVNNLSDGQVLAWRAYDQRWHNENKAAVGDGKALELKNGETTICLYSGESDQSVDVGKWNNVTLTKVADNVADIRYVGAMESTSSETAKLHKASPEAEGRTFAIRDTDGYLHATTPAVGDNTTKTATTANVVAKITSHDNDTAAHPATFVAQFNTFKNNTLGYRKKLTLYANGAVANCEGLPTGWYLEVVTAGTTSNTGIVLPETITENASVIDGTVTWKIRKTASTHDIKTNNNRQPSTAYNVGDIRYYEQLPVGWFLECSTTGTTDSGDITIPSPLNVGDTVTDGAVVWTIRKIGSGDGVPLGAIIAYSANGELPSGYLLCDGSAVSRSMFPDLFAAIGTRYGAGDGFSTFNLPDLTDKFIEGGATAGTVKQPGLPNITGETSKLYANNGSRMRFDGVASGAFSTVTISGSRLITDVGYSATNYHLNDTFDASRSNPIYGASDTVQPPALTMRYIIKAFNGMTADSALIDVTQFANEIVAKADRGLSNLNADGKQAIIDYNMPDYANGIDWSYTTANVDANYTAPDDGWVAYVITSREGNPGKFALNNKDILYTTSSSTSYPSTYGGLIRVSANDVITICSMYAATTNPDLTALTFYPNKEVIA